MDIKQAARNGDAQKIGAISLDVAGSFDSIQASFSSAEQCRGPIDMLINCAGIACCKSVFCMLFEQRESTTDVFAGTLNLPLLRSSKGYCA